MNRNTTGIILMILIVATGYMTLQIFGEKPELNETTIEPTGTETQQSKTKESGFTETIWIWEETVYNNGDTIIPNSAEAFTIQFFEDGTVGGTTDCNNFRGPYIIEDGELTVGPLATTLMYCEGSQESEFTGQLQEINGYFITEEGKLALLFPFDSGSIVFTAQE